MEASNSGRSVHESQHIETLIQGFKQHIVAVTEQLERTNELVETSDNDRLLKAQQFDQLSVKLSNVIACHDKRQIKDITDTPVTLGPYAERLLESLQSRLTVTERLLKKSYSDSSEKLSELEERLLNDNSILKKLQHEAELRLTLVFDRLKNVDAILRNDLPTTDCSQDRDDCLPQIPVQPMGLPVSAFQSDVSILLREKNSLVGQLRYSTDALTAVNDENERLRSALQQLSTIEKSPNISNHYSCECSVILATTIAELSNASSCAQRLTAANQRSEIELQAVRDVVEAQRCSLNEAALEIQRLGEELKRLKTENREMESQIQELCLQIARYNKEIEDLYRERNETGQEFDELVKIMASSERKLFSSEREEVTSGLETNASNKKQEASNSEKDLQLIQLRLNLNESMFEKEAALQSAQLYQQQVQQLLQKIDQLSSDVRQKAQDYENLSMSDNDQRMELESLKHNLTMLHKELADKDAQLKATQLLCEVHKEQQERKHITDNVYQAGYSSTLRFEEGSDSHLESNQLLSVLSDLQKANSVIDTLVVENAELKSLCRQWEDSLLAERDIVSRLTYDKMIAQQRFYNIVEERDSQSQQSFLLETQVKLLEIEVAKLSATLHADRHKSSFDIATESNA